MIQNPITFVLDASGNYLGQQRGTIRALSNYASKIYVVAPFESVALKVNYLVYGTQREVIGQYLAPTSLYGRDVLASTDTNLSTASNWQVWEVSISQRALHRIAKYRAGRIGVSFQVLSIAQPSQALTYIGTLTSADSLPNPATYAGDDGDYYVSDVWNYTDQYIAGTFAKGTYFYFDTNAWVEGQNITYTVQTTTVDLAVDPSLLAELPADISEDAELIDDINELIGDVATLQATLNSHIIDYTDPHDLQANQVESTDGNVQTDIDNLQGDIADITDGTTPLDYTVTTEEYISAATYIRDAIKELDGNAYATDQQLANDISLKVSKALSNTLTSLATDDKIYVYDTTASDAKFITVADFLTQVVVDLASFGIVILGEGEYDEENDIPTYPSPLPNKLYLYDNPTSAPDNYDEWLWTGTAWEKLGVFGISLENYYTKTETDALIIDAKTIQYYPKTKNTSGSQILKGAVVQFAGSTGTEIEIKEAVASEINDNPELLMGVAYENIPANQEEPSSEDVVWFGEITGLDLTGFSDGDILYFDIANGGFVNQTAIPQTNKIIVAAVVKGGSGGALIVRPKWVSRDIDDVDGLQTALDGKVDLVGDSNITGNVNISGNVGIGTTNPSTKLHILSPTSNAVSLQTSGADSIIGINLQNDARIWQLRNNGSQSDKFEIRDATAAVERLVIDASGNIGIGTTTPQEKLDVNGNIALGGELFIHNPATENTFVGVNSGKVGLTGDYNTALGQNAFNSATSGSVNTAIGVASLRYNTSGGNNTAIGAGSLGTNVDGSENTSIGRNAGRNIENGSDNVSGSNNTFIGAETKALADNDQNETVIGYNAIGNGSNTVTLGNDAVTDTHLKGTVHTTSVKIGSWTLSEGATGSLDFTL